jgi:2',3'-cyclic-nucleotide 2'-phosphodiesterase (5'-nucleotidase family)
VRFPVVLLFAVVISACGTHYLPAHNSVVSLRMKPDSLHVSEPEIEALVSPFRMKLDSLMNEVICITDTALVKAQPEGSLGNMMADAVLQYGKENFAASVDLCVLNYGGIRIPVVEKGPVTIGTIFELMPFDNMVEVLEIDGARLKVLLDHTARYGGWPVSSVRMVINNQVADSISVDGEPLELSKSYRLITSDYIANGGDGCYMLKDMPKKNRFHYKLRDVLTDHFAALKKKGETYHGITDGRVRNIAQEVH